MVTQKLPIVNGKRQVPSWKDCLYNSKKRGHRVVISKNVHLFEGFLQILLNVIKLEFKGDCKIFLKGDLGYKGVITSRKIKIKFD